MTQSEDMVAGLYEMQVREQNVGASRERQRIMGRIMAQICFDALQDNDFRCSNHNGKCYELGLLVKELAGGKND